jgi:TetR/AcrR family transcriptional regulator, fatty acid biosynthesis regulator
MTLNRAERKALTRQKILDAAMQLLAGGRGLDSLGLREVARQADLAAPSLYNHFPEMDGLRQALVDQACFRLRNAMRQGRRELIVADPARGVRDLVGRFLAYLAGHEAEFRLLVQQRLGTSTSIRRRVHRELQLLVEELADDIRSVGDHRGLPAVDDLRAAEAAVAVMFGYGILALDMTQAQRQGGLDRVVVQLSMVFLGARALTIGARLGDTFKLEGV